MNTQPLHLVAIAAMARNRVIGNGLTIPWKHSADMKYFKEVTTGHTVLMGSRTYESLDRPLGLPNRVNIVVSGTLDPLPGEVILISSLSKLGEVTYDRDKIFVIGGARMYEQLLPSCQELLLTMVDEIPEGDVVMPPFEHLFEQPEVIRQEGPLTFLRYKRLQGPGRPVQS